MWDWCGACRLVGRIVGLLDALYRRLCWLRRLHPAPGEAFLQGPNAGLVGGLSAWIAVHAEAATSQHPALADQASVSLCYREPSLCHDQMLQLIQNGMGFDLMTVPKCESKRLSFVSTTK